MLKYFLLFIVLVFTACQNIYEPKLKSIESITPPAWYLNLPKNKNIIIGYGEGKSLQEAKANARNEIAKSINVTVSSNLTMNMTLKNKIFEENESSLIEEQASAKLKSLIVLKEEINEGKYFVALEYNNHSLIEKISSYLKDKDVSAMSNKNPLYKSNFSMKLKHTIGFVPNYNLNYKDGIFYVSINNEQFVLDENHIKFLFSESISDKVSIQTKNRTIKNNDFFYINVVTSTSGYMNLFNIDENGKVSVMLDNKFINKEKYTYPDQKLYNGLQATIIGDNMQIFENFIVVLCKDEKAWGIFDEISSDYNTNDEAVRFPVLYTLIKECAYSGLIVKIKR